MFVKEVTEFERENSKKGHWIDVIEKKLTVILKIINMYCL